MAPERADNSVGALVDQLLEQVNSGMKAPGSATSEPVHFFQQTTVSINGKSYENLERVPKELRDIVSRGLAIAERQGPSQRAHAPTTFAVASNVRVTSERSANGPASLRIIVGLLGVALILVVILAAVLFAQVR